MRFFEEAKVPEVEERVVKKSLKDGRGPAAMFIVEFNRSTKEFIKNGNNFRTGREYVLYCHHTDGKRAYLGLKQK